MANGMDMILNKTGRGGSQSIGNKSKHEFPTSVGSSVAASSTSTNSNTVNVKLNPDNPRPFIRHQLITQIPTEEWDQKFDPKVREQIRTAIEAMIRQYKINTGVNRKRFIDEIFWDVVGFGPIEPLLNDSSITEIMVNRYDEIFIEVEGRGIIHVSESENYANVKFEDETHLRQIITRIAQEQGRGVNEGEPLLDTRLPDGSRVNAVLPPVGINGSNLTIRKFKEAMSPETLLETGTLTPEAYEFLQQAVFARLSIVISGGTSSGKTTTLNCVSSFIPNNERIVTIEDAAELQLQQRHVVPHETKPGNKTGTGEYRGSVTIRDLVRNSLRQRPDRIVVGECRGGEAIDMLQAMNTGHDGSLTTVHANNPRDCCRRLEVMSMMAGLDVPIDAIREQIASAVDLIVQQSRRRDGTRRIMQITEVVGMDETRGGKNGRLYLRDIFKFKDEGIGEDGKIRGKLELVDMPSENLLERFALAGAKLPACFDELQAQHEAEEEHQTQATATQGS